MKVFVLVALIHLLVAAVVVSQKQIPLDIHRVHAAKRLGTPVASPSGEYAVYTVRYWNEQTKKTTTWLEAYSFNSSSTKQLTNPASGADYSPAFSMDGQTVFFLSTRDGSVQIYTIPASADSTTNPTKISNLAIDIDNLKVAPNGRFVVFSAQVYIDCANGDFACTRKRNDEVAARGVNSWREYDQLFVRHWDTWETPNMYSHLFTLSISQKGLHKYVIPTNAQPNDIMFGMKVNCPIAPFGGAEEFNISPLSDEIAFTGELAATSARAWTTGWKVFRVSLTQPGAKPISITDYTDARTQDPTYSPDGRYIAYLAMDRPLLESDKLHLVLYDRNSGAQTPVAINWMYSVAGHTWSRDAQFIIVDADANGYHSLFAIDPRSGNAQVLVEDGHNYGQTPVPFRDILIFSRDSLKSPADLFQVNFKNGKADNMKQLTNANGALLQNVYMSERIGIKLNTSYNIGWMLNPYGFDPKKTYPLAFLVHGGPEGAWDDAWSYRWNPQLWAAHGYVVLMINPEGSTGYGQKYTDAVRQDWGGAPFNTLMNGLDQVVAQYPYIDKNRMCSLGASYGGYMQNWINAQTSAQKKFKCIVNHDGVFDAVSMAYSTEELWFTQAEFGGLPYNPSDYPKFEKFNPRNFVDQMTTPMLVIHGGKDFRIPESEGISAFTALQRRGIESKFLYFEMENHWVLKPDNSIKWYDTVLAWLDKFTQNTPPSKLQ